MFNIFFVPLHGFSNNPVSTVLKLYMVFCLRIMNVIFIILL